MKLHFTEYELEDILRLSKYREDMLFRHVLSDVMTLRNEVKRLECLLVEMAEKNYISNDTVAGWDANGSPVNE